METTLIKSEKELKSFLNENRKNVTNINGIEFTELYPMLSISNKNASYYDVELQENKFLYRPFTVVTK